MINVKNLVLGIGIVIVYALVLWQGIEAFYPSPQYEDYCNTTAIEPRGVSETEQQCLDAGGIWTPQEVQCVKAPCPQGYCDFSAQYKECNDEYNNVRGKYSWVVFIVSIILGMIVLVIGYGILSIEPVGSALIASGIWSIFWGAVVNWSNFSNIYRFLLLLAALVLIIFITVRLNTNRTKKKHKN